MSHADVAIMQACVRLGNALKCILGAISPGLGGGLLSGALLVIANRLEFCSLCMRMYNEFSKFNFAGFHWRLCLCVHVLL